MKTKVEIIINSFGIRTVRSGDLLIGVCPVHNGDNRTAFNINTNTNSRFCGRWFCNTHGCHKDFGGDIFSLIRALTKLNYRDSIEFSKKFINHEQVNHKYDILSEILMRGKNNKVTKIDRNYIRSKLKIPAEYYLNRGFSIESLDYFDVGLCESPEKEMFNRVVFPVYDPTDTYMIGSVGRSVINDKAKWKTQNGFKSADYLYGYNKTVKYVCRHGSAILVEGQGDVIKLWMAGIKNVFGLFGSNLNSAQELLLQKTGITDIITFGDNDVAGNKLRKSCDDKLKRLFNVKHVVPELDGEDPGDMAIDKLKFLFTEFVDD